MNLQCLPSSSGSWIKRSLTNTLMGTTSQTYLKVLPTSSSCLLPGHFILHPKVRITASLHSDLTSCSYKLPNSSSCLSQWSSHHLYNYLKQLLTPFLYLFGLPLHLFTPMSALYHGFFLQKHTISQSFSETFKTLKKIWTLCLIDSNYKQMPVLTLNANDKD